LANKTAKKLLLLPEKQSSATLTTASDPMMWQKSRQLVAIPKLLQVLCARFNVIF
jgi:hypothetical protein